MNRYLLCSESVCPEKDTFLHLMPKTLRAAVSINIGYFLSVGLGRGRDSEA